MWKGSEMDPGNPEGGGTSTNPPPNQELIDLKDQYEQQQVLISQLKEMLRKSEQTTVTAEKVEEYANTLNRMRAKAKQGRLQKKQIENKDETKEVPGSRRTSTVNIQAKEKLLLLRQQLEENKVKLAQRDKNQKGLEEMVTQLKAQLDDSQQVINQTPLNLSLAEPKIENLSPTLSSEELYNVLLIKERRITDLNAKVARLETNVLDLHENLKEKDSVIDARTKAITLMSENLSKKGKHTLDELEDTKEQMRKMQENFVTLESQLNTQKQNLLKQLKEKNSEIEQLEKDRNELLKKNTEFEDIIKKYEIKITELENPKEGNQILSEESSSFKRNKKGRKSQASQENSKVHGKINELNKIINEKDEEIRSLQNTSEEKSQENNNLIEKLGELEKYVEEKQIQIDKHLDKIKELEQQIHNLNETIDNNLKIEKVSSEENEEILKIKKQLDEYNKNMIKVKAQHKSKLKELNKKIEEFKKISDTNAEIVKLHNENSKLKQQITEIETKMKENDANTDARNTGELEEKQKLIISLEEEIQIYKSEILALKEQLGNFSAIENAQVTSEINNIHLEEQIDNLEALNRKLELEKKHLSDEHLNLLEQIEELKREKQDISARLDQCLQENMELVDKLDKLSAEKVSSAESIEIVEALTQQEKLELEEYQKSLDTANENVSKSEEHLEQNPELNESVSQLTEETSDLLRKIELFTEERREVMEKMESLMAENNQLHLKIKEIENNRDILAETYEQLQNDKEELDNKLQEFEKEHEKLNAEIENLQKQNQSLQENIQVKHGNIVEETINLETVTPLQSSNAENINKKLQEEIVEYKALIEIQKQEIKELKLQLLSSNTSDDLKQELGALEAQYEALLSENQKLKEAIKINSELAHEKDTIEEQLRHAKIQANDLETKLTKALREIDECKLDLEQKTDQLGLSNNKLTNLQDKIEEQQAELLHYESTINHLNSLISELTNKSDELQSLRDTFEKNMKQIDEYEEELTKNSKIIVSLENELKKLNTKILETEHLLESKDDEIAKLKKENENKETLIGNLREEIRNKDEQFHKACDQLRERCLAMQNQIEQNADSINDIRNPLEEKIRELENKNREQLEKMKKLAANLRKKTIMCQEFENTISELKKTMTDEMTEKEKLHVEIKEKNESLLKNEEETRILLQKLQETTHIYEEKVKELETLSQELHDLKEKENVLQPLQAENAQLKSQISQYIAINNDLQNIKAQYETQIDALSSEMEIVRSNMNNALNTEIIRKNEMITSLNEQLEVQKYNYEASLNASQAKVQELELYIETQEAELTRYRDKANKFEEGLSVVEERRASLERRATELGAQLEEKLHSYEEASHNGDILEQRLSALIIHDEIIEKRLQEAINENQELVERNRFLLEENTRLRNDLSSASGKIVDVSDFLEKISILENENAVLDNTKVTLENECKNMQADFTKKLLEKEQELDSLETELQSQIEITSNERKNLMSQSEHLQDQLKESKENMELLQEELKEYKNKLAKQEIDLQNSLAELEGKKAESQNSADVIHQLQAQLQSNKDNSSNSQALIDDLQSQIALKDAQIVEYQRQNLQLQIQMGSQTTSSFFEDASPANDFGKQEEEIKDLKLQLSAAQETIDKLRIEKQTSECKIVDMNEKIEYLNKQITSFKRMYAEDVSQRIVEEVIISAEEKVSITKDASEKEEESTEKIQSKDNENKTFTAIKWDNVANDPFEFVSEQFQAKHVQEVATENVPKSTVDNSKKELENKLKTLQFMLFNAEKERDDALAHCNQLTNELAQLIYKREQQKPPQVPSEAGVELQIVPEEQTSISDQDLKQLQNIEFTPVRFTETDGLQPIEEVVAPPKSAYLEYAPEQSQSKAISQQAHSVSVEVFDENDDGWGWSPEETKLEEEHIQRIAATPQNTSVRISQLEEKIRVLELDRERHLEEIRQSQIKSGKLIKKLKELKVQNDKLTFQKAKLDDFSDLDNTIQEELKLQADNLEKKLKEMNDELNHEKIEKTKLLQQIETLKESKDRMLEMKKEQDIEIVDWKRKNRELILKLEQLEWGDDVQDSPKKSSLQQQSQVSSDGNIQELQGKINDLNETIKELTLDNEELQTLLEEQRNLRINAEKSKSLEPTLENMKTEAEYLALLSDKNELQEKIDTLEMMIHNLDEQLKEEIESKIEMEKVIGNLQEEKEGLGHLVVQNNNYIFELQNQIQNQNAQVVQPLEDKMKIKEEENTRLTAEIQSLNSVIQQLQTNTNVGMEELHQNIEMLQKEKVELFTALQEKNIQIENLSDMISEINRQKHSSEEELAKFKTKTLDLEAQIQEKSAELANLKSEFGNADALKLKLLDSENDLLEKSNECRKLQSEVNLKSEEYQKLQKDFAEKSEMCKKFESGFEEQTEKFEILKREFVEKSQQLDALSSKMEEKDAEYESKLSMTVQQLAQEWAERVDQRGSDVAESWKLHLEARETEFVQLEQQLRKEIFELESKFNVLVNENNELRKNVDAEIRNEVDRISALQQQINDGQQANRQLTQLIEERQHEIDTLNKKIKDYDDELIKVRAELQTKADAFEKLMQDKESHNNEIQDTYVQQLNKKQQSCDNFQEELHKFKDAFNENLHSLDNCQKELAAEKDMCYSLEILNTNNKKYIESISQKLEETNVQLSNANKTIIALENQVKHHEDHITDLMKEIDQKQVRINEFAEQNSGFETLSEDLRNKDSVINQMKSLISEKEREFSYILESKLKEQEYTYADQVQELNSLKQRLIQTENHYEELLSVKEGDIQNLNSILQEQTNKNELFQKESIFHENELKEHLQIKEDECENFYKVVEEQRAKLAEYQKLNEEFDEKNKQLTDENKQVEELQKIIEEQVLKIEEMKRELYEKSKDYDSLIAEMEMHDTPRNSSAGPDPGPQMMAASASQDLIQEERKNHPDSESNEPVSRAELDLALYMLHQRDVRCEELTVELMQLLEERDTLQLKLSNALREKEELRNRILLENSGEDDEAPIEKVASSAIGAISKSKASAIVLGATGTELATEATEQMQKAKHDSLSTKLSELKSVGYRRDKTILDEQEQRRLQQLALMQQYQEVGAMLPPEAAAKLVQDANYTLSRDVQSPSKVLLNWLWGRSTPKVNEI